MTSDDMSPETHEPLEQAPTLTPAATDSNGIFADEPSLTELIVEQYEGERLRGLFEGEGFVVFTNNNFYEVRVVFALKPNFQFS